MRGGCETLILDMISLDCHRALWAGAGYQAEAYKARSMKENWGKFVLVVEGSIPTRPVGFDLAIAADATQRAAR